MRKYKKTSEPLINNAFGEEWWNSRFIESLLFLLLIVIETILFFYLIGEQRIVAGHDGFEYFNLRYIFLNNAVNAGEIPQWMPYVVHGTVVPVWYIQQGGLLQNALLLVGALLQGQNFLPLFYAGLFLDELLLLVGVWLLGRRFFASPFTVFFTALSIMGSCIWLLQPSWNFHFYYAIPLILYLVHIFLDSGKWRYLFLAGNLLFIQSLGGLPYFLPVISLVVFLYFLFYFFFNHKQIQQTIKALNFGWPFVFSILLTIISFIALYTFMTFGTEQLAIYGGRGPDGTNPLDVFLSYGGQFCWGRWLELFLGISPCVDYTLYIGVLGVPLIMTDVFFNTNRKNFHFLFSAIVLFLFSAGTLVSVFFYHFWPMMDYFRHLVLVAPIIKVFLCFLAGFGLDAVLFGSSFGKDFWARKAPAVLMLTCFLFLFYILWRLSDNHEFYVNLLQRMAQANNPPTFIALFKENIFFFLLGRTMVFALLATVLFFVLFFVKRGRRTVFVIIVFLLGLHFADLYSFKFSEIQLKTVPLDAKIYKIAEFQPMPYVKRRDIDFREDNPRVDLIRTMPTVVDCGGFYWSLYGLLFQDQLGNAFRTDFWLLPFDKYQKAYWRQDIHDTTAMPRGLYYRTSTEYPRLEFPKSHPAALKISGVTEDKLQFFSQAHFVSSEDMIASNITSADYKGDMVFLSPFEKSSEAGPAKQAALTASELSANDRLHFPYQVERFDCNHLVVTTRVDDQASAWLFYSDVWHPLWRATVNGRQVPVYRANLAYKAVKLEKGANTVHFYFLSGLVSTFYLIVGLNAMVWLGIIVFLAGRIVFAKREGNARYSRAPSYQMDKAV